MLDGRILARRVHGLEDQQERPGGAAVEQFLALRQALHALPQQRRGSVLLQFGHRVSGRVIGQVETFGRRNLEPVDKLADTVRTERGWMVVGHGTEACHEGA